MTEETNAYLNDIKDRRQPRGTWPWFVLNVVLFPAPAYFTLLRVREFTQDDAHILCTPEQLDGEIKGVLDFVKDVMGIFQFEYELEISTQPEKSIGLSKDWERATNALIKAMEDNHLQLAVDYIGVVIEPDDPLGQYQVRVTARDLNANLSLDLKQGFTAIEETE